MLTKEILEELYINKLYSQLRIAKELKVSKNSISKLMKDYEIPLRDRSETAYLQHGKTFSPTPLDTNDKALLYGLGLGLYWGEGNKVDPYNVRLGNTDSALICIFVKFLKEICGVHEGDIKYGLQIFNDANPIEAKSYWMNILGCEESAFHPTVSLIPPQGKGVYKRKNKHGVLQVYVSNKKFKIWLMNEINQFAEVAQW